MAVCLLYGFFCQFVWVLGMFEFFKEVCFVFCVVCMCILHYFYLKKSSDGLKRKTAIISIYCIFDF